MIHERLDLDKWSKHFRAKYKYEYRCRHGTNGPLPIAYVEQIRAELKKRGGDLGEAIPVDLCIWNVGDTLKREVTKIGGVPYWPANEPWPITKQANL